MSDREFAEWLRSVPRVIPASEAQRHERERDRERGAYVPPSDIVHHVAGEARH